MVNTINNFAKKKVPFFFCIDYEKENGDVFATKENSTQNYRFSFPNLKDIHLPISCSIHAEKLEYDKFYKSFCLLQEKMQQGYSWLANLTFSVPIQLTGQLIDFYYCAQAPYRVYKKDSFLSFSPESFVKIRQDRIESSPMKGTKEVKKGGDVQAAIKELLASEKELAEQYTITDLLRNDLSRVARKVRVEKFRYVDKIETKDKIILQTSTLIAGYLPLNYQNYLGNILWELLPAGSVSGAPKKETVNILKEIEKEKRGFYCGIAGYFDGESLDSCVLIRFIEKRENQFFYRTGAGITVNSLAEDEYQEILSKIYVPIY